MRDLPRQPYFVQEAVARPALPGDNQLQRDRRPKDIVGAPDVAHASLSEPRDHAVAAGKHVARRERLSRGGRRRCARIAMFDVVVGTRRRPNFRQQRMVRAGEARKVRRSAAS